MVALVLNAINIISYATPCLARFQIFLDVVEKLNLLVGANGTVLHSEIVGAVKMKSFLSGMPELKLGLNDKLMFEATGRAAQAKGKVRGTTLRVAKK